MIDGKWVNDKRRMFVGKRDNVKRRMFVGKRRMFVGKRGQENKDNWLEDFDSTKRRMFVGKRDSVEDVVKRSVPVDTSSNSKSSAVQQSNSEQSLKH